MKKKNGTDDNGENNNSGNKLSANSGFGVNFNVDSETAATVSAQCLEFKVSPEEFLSVAVRLFIDFKYIAEVIGLDIFTMRDELIKAIIKSLGDKNEDAGEGSVRIDHKDASAAEISGKIEKITNLLNGIKSVPGGMPAETKGVSARLEVQSNKIDSLNIELSEIKAMIFDLKNSIDENETAKIKNTARKAKTEEVKNGSVNNENKAKKMEINGVVSELKSPHAASYKEKRRKLDKLKF